MVLILDTECSTKKIGGIVLLCHKVFNIVLQVQSRSRRCRSLPARREVT